MTPAVPVETVTAPSVLVAGLRPERVYRLQHELLDGCGEVTDVGPERLFATGLLPEDMPAATPLPATGPASSEDPILLAAHIPVTDAGIGGVAYDADGAVVWYARSDTEERQVQTVLPGGRFLDRVVVDPSQGGTAVAETDLIGAQLRRVSLQRVNEALVARGEDPVLGFHHDIIELPEGRLALLAYEVGSFDDIRVVAEPTLLLEDAIIVVDANLDVVWSWSGFDHLDLTRAPGLGETCGPRVPGCPRKPEANGAEDWMHSNAIAYDPRDGNLLVSIRHRDWVAKIDYEDGAGDGEILWRLGGRGDFTLTKGNLVSWPTHGHDVNVLPDGRIIYFDNGNSRCAVLLDCESRGQIWSIDEEARTATLDLDVRLGVYAPAVGSAQALSGGGFAFGSGIVLGSSETFSHEVDADGHIVKEISSPRLTYRYYRLPDLYSGPPIARAEAGNPVDPFVGRP